MDGSSSHPRSAMDSSSTLLLLDPQMADQLYVCLAEATGYGSYNRTELLQELLFGTQSGHNYAAYFTACVRLAGSIKPSFANSPSASGGAYCPHPAPSIHWRCRPSCSYL
eukprot:scaffold17883_cov36-Tisochrysis_lutea.AAC.4